MRKTKKGKIKAALHLKLVTKVHAPSGLGVKNVICSNNGVLLVITCAHPSAEDFGLFYYASGRSEMPRRRLNFIKRNSSPI